MKRRTITIQVKHKPIRMDLALLEALQNGSETKREISRAALKKYLHENQVLWRGSPAIPSQIIPPGTHEIVLLRPDLESRADPQAAKAPPEFSLPIVYEDEDLFVIHKPTGIPSAPLSPDETNTAVNFAVSKFPEIARVGRHVNGPINGKLKGLEPALLHRLDTGTSGLLVFAKHQIEFERLSFAWKNREIQKYYRALVHSSTPLPGGSLRLDFPIAHDAHSAKKMVALISPHTRDIRGKPLEAVTHILSARRCSPTVAPICQTELKALADFEIKIETGVMHQIRCQLSAKGWPILGDPIYKGAPSNRLWLHAWRLKIPLKTGTLLTLEALLPEDWPTS